MPLASSPLRLTSAGGPGSLSLPESLEVMPPWQPHRGQWPGPPTKSKPGSQPPDTVSEKCLLLPDAEFWDDLLHSEG